MNSLHAPLRWLGSVLVVSLVAAAASAQPATTRPAKVYVPYDKLKGVFESEKQGVFLPYAEFQRLWRAARGDPAAVAEAPAPYLVSTARFTGKVGGELAEMQLELTVDILADGWVEVPIGLADVAVSKVRFAPPAKPAPKPAAPTPLLRVVGGKYVLLTKGKGRRTLVVDFVRQLVTQPGLNVLNFRIPAAAITTLELAIPEENMKVDVEPMLAATTDQVDLAGKKATRLRAFLGAATAVKLSWKPKTQAAAELAPVIISEQLQHIDVAEALIRHDVTFTYDIRRRGVDSLTVQLPGGFRVTGVEGANIAKWDIDAAGKAQNLRVQLFSQAKGKYTLTVRMELFLKESTVKVQLAPIVTQQVLRRTGLVAVTHSPRRSVELTEAKDLARVDTGRLPKPLRGRSGATAWRFITADYGGTLEIDTIEPRITAAHLWTVSADSDRMDLHGRLTYQIERAGLFQLSLNLPEPWEIQSIGPSSLVDDHQLAGAGPTRKVNILLKREVTGSITLTVAARAPRTAADAPIDFALPLADAKNVRLYSGQVLLSLADRLRAEVDTLRQLQSLPLGRATKWAKTPGTSPVMAFEFRSIDRTKAAGAAFRIAVKPTQVSAVVHRLVDVQPGSVQEEAVIDYRILYAPVDTLYLKMPAGLADAGVRIDGPEIKEKPRIDELPADQRAKAEASTRPAVRWAYYKIALQSPTIGQYRLRVTLRRKFQASEAGKAAVVVVEPILAAGKLSDQTGFIAVAKADTLAIGEPTAKDLTAGDPTSAADVPESTHRGRASLAFRYDAPPFELSLPVYAQQEADVFTTIATGAIVEQVLGRDGTLTTHATYLIATSRGDRLPVTLPAGATLFSVLLNGSEAAVERAGADQIIVRLPPSAGQVTRLVLEVRYAVESGPPVAPELPEEIPVQQTLWRLRVPEGQLLLWFDPVFSRLASGPRQLSVLAGGYPGSVGFKLAEQGRAWDFICQGAPGRLKVLTCGKEAFNIAVWAVILLVGAAALKLCWFHRCLLVLLAALLTVGTRLVAPLLAWELVRSGLWAGMIVLGLWAAHWLFRALPHHIRSRPGRPDAPPPELAPVGEADQSDEPDDEPAEAGEKE